MGDTVVLDQLSDAVGTQSTGFPAGIIGDLAQTFDDTRKSLDKYKRLSTLRPLQELKQNIDQLTEEELAVLKKVAGAKENQNLWNYGHVISSSLYATACIIFGAYLIYSGEEKGKSFIYSGTALLTSTLMSYHGGWKSVARLVSAGNGTIENTLNIMLPLAATLMTWMLTASKLDDVLPLKHKEKIEALMKLMSWVNMLIHIGSTYTAWVKGQAERQQIYIEAQIKAVSLRIEPINLRNEAQTDLSKRVNDAIKGGIKRIFNGTAAIPRDAV
jgi:hypothetical protein